MGIFSRVYPFYKRIKKKKKQIPFRTHSVDKRIPRRLNRADNNITRVTRNVPERIEREKPKDVSSGAQCKRARSRHGRNCVLKWDIFIVARGLCAVYRARAGNCDAHCGRSVRIVRENRENRFAEFTVIFDIQQR